MGYSQDLKNVKVDILTDSLSGSATTAEIDLQGGTLVGVLLEANLASTTFTITVARETGGTFVTVKDPTAGGNDKTYTVGATSTGYFPIDPIDTAGFRFCKIVFDSSETADVYIMRRNID